MWHAARQQEKKIKELMVDHKKRAERRRAYYESRLGDPSQLLRITGGTAELHANAEQHFFYENPEKSLMTWQGDAEARIDRFDGRALLDYLPPDLPTMSQMPNDERDIQEELNFERFRDLVENERRNVSEQECLEEIETEWTSLLARHKAMIKKLQEQGKSEGSSNKGGGYSYDYGTEKRDAEKSDEEESRLLDEEDILDYVENLTDKDRQILNEMGRKYNIPDYTRLLRVAKRDREEKAKELKESEKIKERKSRRHKHGSRKERRRDRKSVPRRSYSARDSPTYEPYSDRDSSSGSSDGEKQDDDSQDTGFVIQFGSSEDHLPESNTPHSPETAEFKTSSSKSPDDLSGTRASSSTSRTREPKSAQLRVTPSGSGRGRVDASKSLAPQKLTPAEKLRLKLQMGLNKQIQVDEKKKIQKEREQELERLIAKEDVPSNVVQSITRRLQRGTSRSRSRDQYSRHRIRLSSSRSRSRERRNRRKTQTSSPSRSSSRSRGRRNRRKAQASSLSRSRSRLRYRYSRHRRRASSPSRSRDRRSTSRSQSRSKSARGRQRRSSSNSRSSQSRTRSSNSSSSSRSRSRSSYTYRRRRSISLSDGNDSRRSRSSSFKRYGKRKYRSTSTSRSVSMSRSRSRSRGRPRYRESRRTSSKHYKRYSSDSSRSQSRDQKRRR